MKRFLSVFSFLALLIGPSVLRSDAGETEPSPAQRESETRILSQDEISRYATEQKEDIRTCFLRHSVGQRRATGEVRIHVIVHPDGHVWQVKRVEAPGVRGKGLSRCVDAKLESWRFPEKKGYTETILPYLFIKTWAPGAGPKQSCWNPRGCRTRDKEERAQTASPRSPTREEAATPQFLRKP
jgi:hypothetical protein